MAAYSDFERARRRASRIALYSGLALALGVVGVLVLVLLPAYEQVEVLWAEVDFAAQPEVQRLQEFVRIDTGATGSELDGARYLAGVLEAEGIEATVLDMGDGHANLWARIEGKSPETLILHNHLDVEPVEDPSVWTHDPFGGQIEGPWIYGRGTFDMKSVTIAQLEAFLAVHRTGRVPARSLMFLATSSEETGSDLGTRWLLEHRPDVFENAWAVLSEGGWVEVLGEVEVKYWGTEIGQKRYVELVLCSPDRERLETVRQDLLEREQPLGDLKLTPAIADFLRVYGPTRTSPAVRARLADPDALIRDPMRFLSAPAPIRSMLRNEVHPFPVRETGPGFFEMVVKLHLLPGEVAEEAAPKLVPLWMTSGLVRDLRLDEPTARTSPVDHPVYRGVQEALREAHPGVETGPLFLPWQATDSRFFRAHDIPAYGFSPFVVATPEVLRLAGAEKVEERIGLLGFVSGVELYGRVVRHLVD